MALKVPSRDLSRRSSVDLEVILGAARLEDLAVELVVGPGQLLGPLVHEMVDLDPGQPQLLLDADALGGVLVHLGGPLGGLVLEDAVAALEVLEGLLQAVEHAVEGPGQQAGFVAAEDAGPLLEVAAGQALGGPRQLDERPGDHAAEKDDAQDAEDEEGHAHGGQGRGPVVEDVGQADVAGHEGAEEDEHLGPQLARPDAARNAGRVPGVVRVVEIVAAHSVVRSARFSSTD